MRKTVLSIGILLAIILSLNFISASGLCRGYDGYYHDCDDSRYYDDNKGYDDYYSYNGRDYPTRDYYYRDYYQPKYRDSKYKSSKNDIEIKYNDVEEYNRVIVYDYEDRYGTQKYKTTLNQKTEIKLNYEIPYYVVYNDLGYSNNDKYDSRYEGDNQENKIRQIPWTYSQYKKYY